MDYLEQLYTWIGSEDNTFTQRYTLEDFKNNMQKEDYVSSMYTWISSRDETFPDRYTLDFFTEKVKKKDTSIQAEMEPPVDVPSITTEMEEAGLSEDTEEESIQDTELPVGSEENESDEIIEETQEVVIPETDTQFSIEGGEVDQETFEQYSKMREEQEADEANPFQDALNNLRIDTDEDIISAEFNYNLNEFGFSVEEAIPGVDALRIVSSDIDPKTQKPYELTVSIDTKSDKQNESKLTEIKDFLTKHKKENETINKLEERIAVRNTKFRNQEDIDNAIGLLNTEAGAFNNRIKAYAEKMIVFNRKQELIKGMSQSEKNSDLGRRLLEDRDRMALELKQEKKDLLTQDNILKNRGTEIDRLAGQYTALKAEMGSGYGITQRGLLKGQGRITSFYTDLMADILVSDFSPLDAVSGGRVKYGAGRQQYENMFVAKAMKDGLIQDSEGNLIKNWDEAKAAQEKGTLKPFDNFESLYKSLGNKQSSMIDSYVKDILRKDVKYDNVEISELGEVTFKRPDAVARYSDAALKKELEKITEDGMVPMARKGLDLVLGDKDTTDEYYDLTKQGFWGGAWIGLAESVPAMIGGGGKAGWAMRTSNMFAQVSDHLNEEMMNDPDFAEISENEKRMVSLPIGIVVGTLEAVGLRNVLNSRGLVNNILLKSIQKYGPTSVARTRGLTFQQVVRNEVDNMIAKGTLIIGAGGLAEFETGLAQEIADIGGKMIYNEIKKADMFQTPESFADGVAQVIKAGGQEMVGGWVMSTIPATGTAFAGKDYEALSDPIFKTFEAISQDNTFFKLNVQKIKDQINEGTKTKEEGEAEINLINDIRGLIPKVPTDLETADKKRAIALLLNKKELIKQRDKLAPELRGNIDKEIGKVDKLLSDLLDGAQKVDPTKARVEEDEITDEQAEQVIKNANAGRAAFGLPPIEITPESIAEMKVKLKKQQDARKKQSPVQETGEVKPKATEKVDEGISNELQDTTREGDQDQSQAPPKKKAKIKEEVDEIAAFEGDTEQEGEVVVQEQVDYETENVTKDGKVKKTKLTIPKTVAETEVDTKTFEPVVRFAKRASRAISKILPNVSIVLHESSTNFQDATGTTGRGFYDPTSQTIHVDLMKGNNKTVAHEVFHALLLNSVKTNAQARALTKRMVSAVAKAKGLTAQQKKKIDEFVSNYDQDIQNEEKLAEVLGVLADGYTKLDAPTKSRVRRWIEGIAKRLGIDIEQFTKTDQDVIDLLNTVASKIREGKVITQKDVKAIKTPKKTQKEQVKDVLGEVQVASIKEITRLTGLPEPTVRRILGQGAKNGELTRVSAGVYTIKTQDGKTAAIIQGADALVEIKKLVQEGVKFDMIFLDPPYDAPGIKGGNRNLAKYDKLSPKQFSDFVGDIVPLLRTPDTPVFFMFSAMPTNKKKLREYSAAFTNNGLKKSGVAIETGKLTKDGKKQKQMFGRDLSEWVFSFTQSGNQRQDVGFVFPEKLLFKQDSKYQTAKPVALLEAIIKASTKAGELILDPFAGSGSTAKAAVRTGRNVVTIEKDTEQAGKIKREIKKQEPKKKVPEQQYDSGYKIYPKEQEGQLDEDGYLKIYDGDLKSYQKRVLKTPKSKEKGRPLKDIIAERIKIAADGYVDTVTGMFYGNYGYPFFNPNVINVAEIETQAELKEYYRQSLESGKQIVESNLPFKAKEFQKLNINPQEFGNNQFNVKTEGRKVISVTPKPVSKDSKFKGREQKDIPQRSRKLAEMYMMNPRGFISARAMFDPGALRRQLEILGMRLGTARDEFTGQITGYYFQRVSRNGRPYFYNPFARQQKDPDSAVGAVSDIVSIVTRLRDNNFSPEAIQAYLVEKKNFDKKTVDAILSVDNFVLSRVPESFSKIQGGILAGIKLFSKINNYRKRLIDNNLTPYGKKITKLNQELEILKSQKNKKRAIQKVEKQIEDLSKRNRDAKIFKNTQTEITDKVIRFMESQPAYIAARGAKGLSTLQAQMQMQIAKSFDATPSVNMANKIRLATAIVNMRAREKDSSRLKMALRNFVRVVLPPEDYSKPETISLIKEIQDATPENLQNVKEKILGLATTKIVKGLEGKIKNILNKNFAKIEGGRAKANIVSASAIKILDQIKSEFATIQKSKNGEALAAYEQKMRLRLEKLSEKTIQDNDTFAEQAAVELILKYAGAQEMDNTDIGKVAALNEILTNLDSIISEGRSELEQQKRESYHTYLKDFEIAWYSITGKKIEMLIQNPDFDPQLPVSKSNEQMILNPDANKLIDKFSRLTDAKKNKARSWPVRNLINLKTFFTNRLITKRLDLPALIEYMTTIPGKMFEGQFAEITSDLVDQSSNDFKFFQMQDKESLENILKEIYGKDYQKAVKEESLTRETDIAIDLEAYEKAKKEYEANKTEENKAELETTTFRFSPMEMAYLIYQYKDPANKAGFETKFGEQYERIMYQMEQLMEEKHSKTMALGEWMRSEAYPSLYNRYNKTYKKVYRVDMPWNQYYIGPIRRENQEVQDIDLLAVGADSWQNTAAPASTKVRMQNKKALATENLLESFVSYQEKMNWFAAYAPTVNRVNKLIANPRLRKIIEINYPEGTYAAVNGMLKKIASKGINKLSQGDIFFNKATSLFVVGRLGVNPTIFLKQLVSFPTYMNEIGLRNWAANALMGAPQMISLAKEISENSVYIQDRYGKNIIRSLENYKNSKSSDFTLEKSKIFTNPYQRLLNAQMFLVKAGDKGAILIGGLPVYLYHKNQYKKSNPGATEQQAIDYAIKRFEKATRSTQQSTDLQNRDYYQDGGVLARTFNMFKTSIIQYLRKEILYARNMYKILRSFGKEGRGTIGQNLRGLLVYHTVLPVLFQYLANGLPGVLAPWDEEDGEDLTRAAIMGNINALFFIGDVIQILGDIYYKKPWAKKITNLPLLEQINGVIDKVSRFTSTTNDEKASELLFELMYEDIPGVAGLNTKSMIRWFNNIKTLVNESTDPKEALLRLFNFSDYQIESQEDRDAKKKRKKGLTKRELRSLYPELYKDLEESRPKLPQDLQDQLDEIKEQKKRQREEILESMRK